MPAGHNRVAVHNELTVVAMVYTKPMQAQARPNPSKEWGPGHTIPPQYLELLTTDICWEKEREKERQRQRQRGFSKSIVLGKLITLQWKITHPRLLGYHN